MNLGIFDPYDLYTMPFLPIHTMTPAPDNDGTVLAVTAVPGESHTKII